MSKAPFVKAITEAVQYKDHHLVAQHLGADDYQVVHVKGGLDKFLNVGDKIKSSDMDDFKNEGFNVHELPKSA